MGELQNAIWSQGKNALKTTLVIIGWLFWITGFALQKPILKIICLGIARVLPHAL